MKYLGDTIQSTAFSIYGMKNEKVNDWNDVYCHEMERVIEVKHTALAHNKWAPRQRTLFALTAARSKVQQTARCYASNYWFQLCSGIQTADVTDKTRDTYECIRRQCWSIQNKKAALKLATGKTIHTWAEQTER